VAGFIALAAIAVVLLLARRREPREFIAGIQESGEEMEGTDATQFSSDDQFVSEYGFSDRNGNSEEEGEDEMSIEDVSGVLDDVSDGSRDESTTAEGEE
jgi:hypothetical protein